MLLPVDLMSLVGAGTGVGVGAGTGVGSSSGNTREGNNGADSPGSSWLLTADMDSSSESGKELINQIFRSYNNDGEANPVARFAADLQALLHTHGVSLTGASSLTTDSSLTPETITLATGPDGVESAGAAWSVDELLQMSMNTVAGGNSLPLGDQTLPVVLSNWLAALTSSAPATPADADTSTMNPGASTTLAANLLADAISAATKPPSSNVVAGAVTLAVADGELQSVPVASGSTAKDGVSGAALAAVDATTLANVPAQTGSDADPLTAELPPRIAVSSNPGSDQDMALRSALMDDANRQAAEAGQLNPGPHKASADAANVSAFRSIQVSAQAAGELTGMASDGLGSQPEPGRAGTLQERTQGLSGQWAAAVAGASSDTAASSSSAQLFNSTDGSTAVNRADQRMFATEAAQQAQSQAAQQTATRTTEGLPRFAMDTGFGQQGWPDSLGRQLLVMSSQGISSAQIRLDPPELGSLTVKVQISADQQASVSFVSQHALVRDALEQQLNRLQDLFRDQGLNLQDVSVSDQSPQQREGQEQGQQGRGRDAGAGEQDPTAAEPVLMRSESLIDFYA
ncbi:MAG: hypothetical protein CMQ34_11335 [Gammaproteobacteria bacterium]|nr:hypothetical protein [Gammaproteobacteria bacterium]|tara:strand:+ start:8191 stop:9909 length:1719 start_codon:yes stop_codon:yes gene_type:complete